MGQPASLLGTARAFARDFPRDQMPKDYLWDVVDYVPLIIDAGLTGRGGWIWGSDPMGGDPVAGILGSFTTGDKLLVIGDDRAWYEVAQTAPYTVVARGSAYTAKQNPVQATNMIVAFDGAGAGVPQLITAPGGAVTVGSMDASAPHAPFGVSYKGYIVVAGTPGEENLVRFSYPGQPAHVWDATSNIPMSTSVTALAALRSVIIVFHAGSVERIRGGTPPHSGATSWDMFPEGLFDRVGCKDPRTIAYWNDNCVFADEHGVHVTDGAVLRNIASQGGILYYWRLLYQNQVSMAACTFLDYYMITVRRSDGSATTLVCDLNRRQWFRFANVYALSYVASTGGSGMERVWAGMAGTKRLGRVSPCFFPVTDATAVIADADGKPVLPAFETGWYRMGREGRKRQRFAYLSYDVRNSASPALDLGFVVSPMDPNYVRAGGLPPTTRYTRYRLPVYRGGYGVAFRVRQLAPSSVTRVYDLAVEGQPLEPSRS